MTNIDTIRESLDKAIKNLCYYDGFDNSEWEKALAALSAIDKELEIWKATVERLQALLKEPHDDAIRREYYRMGVEAAIAEWKSLRSTIGRGEMVDNVRQVLLGAEPAREDTILNGQWNELQKVLNYEPARETRDLDPKVADCVQKHFNKLIGVEPAREES